MQKLETSKENISFARVDADHIDNLIKKEENTVSKLNEEEQEQLKTAVSDVIASTNYNVQVEAMSSDAAPFMITQPEFMRRMKEMQATGGGMMGMGNMPDMYNLVVNSNHELISKIVAAPDGKKQELIKQSVDLAKLSQGLLKGKDLTDFIKRSYDLVN